MQKVKRFSQREFTDDSDVLWAFLGILKGLKTAFPQGFIWAVPHDRLDEALLWRKCCVSPRAVNHLVPGKDGALYRLPIPSWTWLAKGYGLYYNPCLGSAIESRVRWHAPMSYEDYDMDISNAEHATLHQSSVFVGPEAPSMDPGLVDFALLHFSAQVASLSLKIDPTPQTDLGHSSLQTIIVSPTGEVIGRILVYKSAYCTCESHRFEFVLLSVDTGQHYSSTDTAEKQEEVLRKVNVMLIEKKKTRSGKSIAVRIALTQMEEAVWNELETTEEDIVLG